MLAQPGGCAWSIYAAPQDAVARQFEDYRNAEAVGALKSAVGVRGLERALALTTGSLVATLDGVARLAGDAATDPLWRVFDGRSVLEPPFLGPR